MAIQDNTLIIKLVFIASIMVVCTRGKDADRCYVDAAQPYWSFSSLTPYQATRGSELYIPKNCSPIYSWALIRHGTRYPTRETISLMKNMYKLKEDILLNHKEKRGSLCENDLKNLEKWNTNLTSDLHLLLTPQGIKDHVFIAQKFKEAFPKLLTSAFKDSFVFQSSKESRTKESAIAFTNELLNTTFVDTNGNNIEENNYLLHLNRHCTRYLNEVYNNPSTFKEANLMKKSEFVQKLLFDISTRLGFKESLSYDLIELMYTMCAYETAWYLNSRCAFCAAFSSEQLNVIEYLNDMNYYYKYGYGNSINEQMGCELLQNMMASLSEAAKNPNNNKKATFHFAHSETIFPLTIKLGLYRDEELLKHDNYEKMIKKRKWRPAFFDSFASNIIAVLYKCRGSQGDQNTVIFYQNERQVVPPKCNKIPCTLEDLQQSFQKTLNETQCAQKICAIEEPIKTSCGHSIFINFSVILLTFILNVI